MLAEDSQTEGMDLETLYEEAFPEDYLTLLKEKEIEEVDDITRRPLCWSPYFFLMKLSNAQGERDRSNLLWNRFFYHFLTDDQKAKIAEHSKKEEIFALPLTKDDINEINDLWKHYCWDIGQPELIGDFHKTYTKKDIDLSKCYADEDHGDLNFVRFIFPFVFNMYRTLCLKKVDFSFAIFHHNADFFFTLFHGEAHFFSARFQGDAHFFLARFDEYANFRFIRFFKRSSFSGAIFEKEIGFTGSEFLSKADFENAHFMGDDIDFQNTIFKGLLSFKEVVFVSKVLFTSANFKKAAIDFTGTNFKEGINIDDIQVKNNFPSFRNPENVFVPEKKYKHPHDTAKIMWRTFRIAMQKDDDIQTELFLFGKEMDVRLCDLKEGKFIRFMIRCYRTFSNYGTSIKRPVYWWMGSIVFFGFIYLLLSFSFKGEKIFYAFFLSFYDATAFIGTLDLQYYHNLIERVFGAGFDSVPRMAVYPIMRVLNKAASALYFALLVLGIRNNLRLK